MIRVEFALSYAQLAQGSAAAMIAALSIVLVVLVRRRRARERADRLLIGITHDFFPPAEHSAIEEIRREVDASYKRSVLRRLEEDWKRDGSILLERRDA